MPATTTYDVFLCHANRDKSEAEEIASRIRAVGLIPFFDQWHLVAGEPWQEELERALSQSRSCAVLLGSEDLSPWQNREMRAALEHRTVNQSYRVIPVLLPSFPSEVDVLLPPFLRSFGWVDFRQGLDDPIAMSRLIGGIKGGHSAGTQEKSTPSDFVIGVMALLAFCFLIGGCFAYRLLKQSPRSDSSRVGEPSRWSQERSWEGWIEDPHEKDTGEEKDAADEVDTEGDLIDFLLAFEGESVQIHLRLGAKIAEEFEKIRGSPRTYQLALMSSQNPLMMDLSIVAQEGDDFFFGVASTGTGALRGRFKIVGCVQTGTGWFSCELQAMSVK
jgi:hypothetical protein